MLRCQDSDRVEVTDSNRTTPPTQVQTPQLHNQLGENSGYTTKVDRKLPTDSSVGEKRSAIKMALELISSTPNGSKMPKGDRGGANPAN